MRHPNLLATCSLDTSETCKKLSGLVAARWKFWDAANPKTNINGFLGKHSFDSFYNKIIDQPKFPKRIQNRISSLSFSNMPPENFWGKKYPINPSWPKHHSWYLLLHRRHCGFKTCSQSDAVMLVLVTFRAAPRLNFGGKSNKSSAPAQGPQG